MLYGNMSRRKTARIKTQFVRDRLRETAWKDREYIWSLMRLETYAIHGRYYSGPDALYTSGLLKGYHSEYEAIRDELATTAEARARLEATRRAEAEWQKEDERQRKARAEAEAEERQREYETWLKAGGKP